MKKGRFSEEQIIAILKRRDKVYTKVISDTKSRTLLPIIEARVAGFPT